jgi:hypothetical protein
MNYYVVPAEFTAPPLPSPHPIPHIAWRRAHLDHTSAQALQEEGRVCPPAGWIGWAGLAAEAARRRFERLHVTVFGPVGAGKSTALHWLCRHAGLADWRCRTFQVRSREELGRSECLCVGGWM